MPRPLLIGAALGAALLSAACKPGVDTAPIAAEAAGLQQHETELLGRRGKLQRERSQLTAARKALSERRAQLGHDGAGQTAIEEEEKQLSDKENDLFTQESAVNQKLDELLRARAELVQKATQTVQGGGGVDPQERATRREQSVAERERGFAKREADIAERERSIADREAKQARREKETCGAAPVVVMPAKVDPGKGKYGAHDVEPVYKKALKLMQERGILTGDLPAGAGKLVEETREGLKAADYVRAKYAADQLLATVSELKIDRNFISAKMARLSGTMRGKKLEGDAGKSQEALFREATASYGDGRFPDANAKLNKIFAIVK